MNKILLAATILTLAATLAHAQEAARAGSQAPAPGSAAAPFKAHVLTRAELDRLLAQPAGVLVIDVRRPDEISSIGGLPVYLSVQVKDLPRSFAWIPKDRTIVTVSNHAKRAGVAADLLAAQGFKVAGAVGVQTYEQEGGTLTRVPVPARHATATAGDAARTPE